MTAAFMTPAIECTHCNGVRYVYDMTCAGCRIRLVKRNEDVLYLRKERRAQALDVIGRTQGAGVMRQTEIDTEKWTKPS